MNSFEQSFVAEFEKIALSKTNILNAPTGAPKSMKSVLGDALALALAAGVGHEAGRGVENLVDDFDGNTFDGFGQREAGILGAGAGAAIGDLLRRAPRQAEQLKELGVKNKFSRLGAAALGAGGGGVLAGLLGLAAAKGVDTSGLESIKPLDAVAPSMLEKLKAVLEPAAKPAALGAALGGSLGLTHPSLLGMQKLPATDRLKNKLKALISKN